MGKPRAPRVVLRSRSQVGEESRDSRSPELYHRRRRRRKSRSFSHPGARGHMTPRGAQSTRASEHDGGHRIPYGTQSPPLAQEGKMQKLRAKMETLQDTLQCVAGRISNRGQMANSFSTKLWENSPGFCGSASAAEPKDMDTVVKLAVPVKGDVGSSSSADRQSAATPQQSSTYIRPPAAKTMSMTLMRGTAELGCVQILPWFSKAMPYCDKFFLHCADNCKICEVRHLEVNAKSNAFIPSTFLLAAATRDVSVSLNSQGHLILLDPEQLPAPTIRECKLNPPFGLNPNQKGRRIVRAHSCIQLSKHK